MKFDINNMISSPAAASATAIQEIPIDMLVPYSNHPFTIYRGERLDDMVNSIKNNGILSPILVREQNGKYEILAGHNRTNAARIAGLTTIPAIVKRNISNAEAEMYVIETNAMQRGFGDLLVSEQAAVVAHRHSKMFDKDKLAEIQQELEAIENSSEAGTKSKLAQVGEEYNLSKNTIARLIRVHKLLTACDEYKIAVDTSALSVRAAVELSYIHPSALRAIAERYKTSVVIDHVWHDSVKINTVLASQLRELFKEFDGSYDDAKLVLRTMDKCTETPRKRTIKLRTDVIGKYFSGNESEDNVNDIIEKALNMYFSGTNLIL